VFWGRGCLGAPEVVVDFCQQGLYGDCVEDFSVVKAEYFNKAHCFAANGERVLGLAFGFIKYDDTNKDCFDETNIPKTLCFHGLLSLIDPPRPGVGDAVNICHEGGIKVITT
jgi:magnesium-transporting ATPase (P-type)